MDIVTISLIVLIVLALGGWGYGSYYTVPAGGARVSPAFNILGLLALVLVVALVVLLLTGWRFGLVVAPP